MNLELVALDGVKFKAKAYSILLPSAAGEINVLPGHEPMLSLLIPGVITVRKDKGDADYHMEHFATYGGVAEITQDGVRILVNEATRGDEINEAEAQKAHDKAVELRKTAKDQVEIDRAQALINRQRVQLHVAGLRRRHRERR